MTIFDHLKNITELKPEWSSLSEEDKKSFNTYMIFKYLSMNKDYIEFINDFQKYQNLSSQYIYTVLKNVIPQKNVWLKFIKSSNKETNKELLKKLSFYFENSIQEVKESLNLLSKDQIKEILIDMGIEDKEIKKLLK